MILLQTAGLGNGLGLGIIRAWPSWKRRPRHVALPAKSKGRSGASNGRSHEPRATRRAHGEPDAVERESGSADGGEETATEQFRRREIWKILVGGRTGSLEPRWVRPGTRSDNRS